MFPLPRHRAAGAVLLVGALATACGASDTAPDSAARTFEVFQQALRRGDVETCRYLLSSESRQVLDEIPWDRVAAQQPLEVLGAHREGTVDHTFVVDVRDPNLDGSRGEYVVVREHGRLVVDLIGSAGRNAVPVEASAAGAPTEQFEPRQLTPADYDRIREYELAQPRGAKGGGN